MLTAKVFAGVCMLIPVLAFGQQGTNPKEKTPQAPTALSKINKSQLDSSKRPKARTPEKSKGAPSRGNHIIAVVNLTDYTIRKERFSGGPWYPVTPLPRTCSTNFDQCFNEGKYLALADATCGVSIQIDVAVTDASGQWYTSGWPAFVPDCNYRGTVIPFE